MPTENRTNGRRISINGEGIVNEVISDNSISWVNPIEEITEAEVTIERSGGIENQIQEGTVTAVGSIFGTEELRRAFEELSSTRDRIWNSMDISSSKKSYQYTSITKEYKPEDIVILRNNTEAKFKDCISVLGHFYLSTDKNIIKDFYRPDVYIHKDLSSPLYNYFNGDGIINTKKIDYFYNEGREMINTVVDINDGNHHVRCDYNSLPKEFYQECLASNRWYHNKIANGNIVDKKQLKIKARKANCIYKASPNRSNLTKDYEMGVVSPTFIKTEGKRYSFGRRKILINY